MQISGIGAGAQKAEFTPLKQNHPEENALQKQIANKQKELEALSDNEEMDPKQKLEKRKEIEAEIAELNNRLQQKRAERLQGKDPEKTEPSSEQARKKDGFSEESERMNSLLSADHAVGQAKLQNSAAEKLTGKARVLRGEAKLDGARGISGEKKIAEASALESRADRIKNESAEKLGSIQRADKAEKTEEAEKSEKEEKDDESERIGDVTYTSDGKLVEASEEKERELDERA